MTGILHSVDGFCRTIAVWRISRIAASKNTLMLQPAAKCDVKPADMFMFSELCVTVENVFCTFKIGCVLLKSVFSHQGETHLWNSRTSSNLFLAVKLTNKSHPSKLSSELRGNLSPSLHDNSSAISFLIHYLPIWMDTHLSMTPRLWIQLVSQPLLFAKEVMDKTCLFLTTSE